MNPIVSNFRPVDGASLVPDYSNANKLAMGIATQIKEGKVKQAVEEESASLQTALSNQNLEDIMNDPVLKNKLLRLYKIDAGMATGLLDVMKSGDAITLAREAQSTKEALDFYTGVKSLYEAKGVDAAKNLVRETIIERDFASANNLDVDLPTDKLKNQLIMQEDDFASELSLNIVKAGGVLSALTPEKGIVVDGNIVNPTTGDVIYDGVKKREIVTQGGIAYYRDTGKPVLEEQAANAERERVFKQDSNAEEGRVEANRMLNLVGDIRKLNTWANTGKSGIALAKNPTSPAADMVRQVAQLKSNLALQTLIKIKREGGTLGALNETEFKALEVSLANVDTTASVAQIENQLQKVEDEYSRLLDKFNRSHSSYTAEPQPESQPEPNSGAVGGASSVSVGSSDDPLGLFE